MSPARAYRERLAAAAADAAPAKPIGADAEGGHPPAAISTTAFEMEMTPAREHRIATAVASNLPADLIDATGASGDPVAAQIAMRLTHDLRRLKEIQSISRKIDAKREMFVEYAPWCDAILSAERANVRGIAAEVLPTMMVWALDICDFDRGLELATHVIDHDVPLPSRYQRSAPALVAELVAETANTVQVAGGEFPISVLVAFETLTADHDMHDQIRAKLLKAIGVEQQRTAQATTGPEAIIAASEIALATMRRAQTLDVRVGVKERIRKLEKLIKTVTAAQQPAKPSQEQPAAAAPTQDQPAVEPPATEPGGEPAAE